MSLNKVILVGRVGAVEEMRSTGSGVQVANFSMATNRFAKNAHGEKTQETEWHRVVAFGRTAEICRDYVKKGDLITIEGRIKSREYDDREGNKRRITEIITENLHMHGKRKENSQTCDAFTDGNGTFGNAMDIQDKDVPF